MPYSLLDDWPVEGFCVADRRQVEESACWRMYPVAKWSHVRSWLERMYGRSRDEIEAEWFDKDFSDTCKHVRAHIRDVVVPAMTDEQLLEFLAGSRYRDSDGGTPQFDELVELGAVAFAPDPAPEPGPGAPAAACPRT